MRDEPWLIVDTETSGFGDPVHVVELAAQRMRGWERDGTPYSVLLNHDVPIDPMAEAVHGYSRQFLRAHGAHPAEAHMAFRQYAGDLPVVSYNISYDWNRCLEPEYRRLGLPPAGRRGFCAMTLSRRVIVETQNYKLDTLRAAFLLNEQRSHIGRNDVETLVSLFEKVLAPRLYQAGLVGFEAVAEFSRRTPVADCIEQVHGAGDPIWYLLDVDGNPQGPFPTPAVREFIKVGPALVWREGMTDWVQTDELPDFTPPVARRRTRSKKTSAKLPEPKGCPPGTTMAQAFTAPSNQQVQSKTLCQSTRSQPDHSERLKWTDELIGLCKGILADGVVNTAELLMLQEWLMGCPFTHIYPMSIVAEVIEDIVADGVVTSEELEHLKQMIEVILETADLARARGI